MPTLQSRTVGSLLDALGLTGFSGISAARHSSVHTRLDITVASHAWAILADTTLLSTELASTIITGLSTDGTYTLWLDALDGPQGYAPVWTVAAAAPTQTAIGVATVVVADATISTVTDVSAGLHQASAALGAPVLYGPYSIDYTDVPLNNNSVTLFTPAVGDVLLRLVADPATKVSWDFGEVTLKTGTTALANTNDGVDDAHVVTPYVFTTTDPVVGLFTIGEGDTPGAGHIDVFGLVAHPVIQA